jgi:DNA-binding CsgD family transcriptional regulator
MSGSAELETGREAYERRAWKTAYLALTAADRREPLGTEDSWRLALSAHLSGHDAEFLILIERAHQACLQTEDAIGAARCAFWLGVHLADRGEMGAASGWLGRANRLLERDGSDCVERGYLLLPAAHQKLGSGDPDGAYRLAADAVRIGERFRDADLLAFALHVQGHALMNQGRVEEGLARMDEAMVAVAADELSPLVTGLVYCSVIGGCRRFYALGRAHEWTSALKAWCDAQPELVLYRGECLVYRAEILQLHGAWQEALAEARRAADPTNGQVDARIAGAAFYQQGEVHRLRGESAAAEDAYRSARGLGREPQPGLALMRLAQGDGDAAVATIRRILVETQDPLRRARLLPASIEIELAAGDDAEARRGCEELEEVAAAYGTSVLDTMLAHARGAVALAGDDALASLVALRQATQGWHELDAPHEAARARVLLALACRELGDDDTFALELDAARAIFEKLGAAPDVARVDALRQRRRATGHHGLTPRELQILALVATGRTNRAIAGELFISEKTVARHVSNIFLKLGLSSRAAATAYAYEHELLEPPA